MHTRHPDPRLFGRRCRGWPSGHADGQLVGHGRPRASVEPWNHGAPSLNAEPGISVLEGPAAVRAVGLMSSQFSESLDGDTPLPVSDWETRGDQMQVHRAWTAETVLDPTTLLPSQAKVEVRITVIDEGDIPVAGAVAAS